MVEFAKIEGDEIVIRIPIAAIPDALADKGLRVTDPVAFAPHMAREMNGESLADEPWINGYLDAAAIRAAEDDAPGVEFVDGDCTFT